MKIIDYLKVDWPILTEYKAEDRKGDKLIERLDGGKAFVSPTTDLIPRNKTND